MASVGVAAAAHWRQTRTRARAGLHLIVQQTVDSGLQWHELISIRLLYPHQGG